ncbi:uncharacterized protein LOC142181872 [Nicotiana tabacum]|uniref:Uncharacterized protein LOC142181872 n=1 Tax=Nicotiana tabacum TaxID=4097 RepID=A0AC58UQ36_TOBAC
MNVPEEYEKASGQKVNKEKSSFYMHEKATYHEANTVHLITEFQRHPFPFTYLGCPIFYSRRKKDFSKDIIFKVQARLHSWKGKLLSNGGRAILIAHVLESMPMHLLSMVNPLKHVITELHKMFARFYWSNSGNENGQWKVDMLRDLLPDELSEHIIENIQPPTLSNIQYKPWWQL